MYFLKRVAAIVPILILISVMAFVLIRIAPGGPFDGERARTPQVKRALEKRFHLDEPIWRQYLHYLGGLVRGDFGPSTQYRNHTVNDIIQQALPVSMSLGAFTFIFAIAVGVPSGILAALRRGQWLDRVLTVGSIVVVCIPTFVLGPMLVMILSVKLGWFPVGLWESPWHVVLPVVTLGLYFAGKIARLTREGMLGALQQDFIRTARAKGASESAIVRTHALRIAILPVVSYCGPLLADLLTGSFVVENLFQIPGIGLFVVNSAMNRDYTMVVGLVLLYSVLLLMMNLLVDLAYTRLDPRVRYD